MASDAVQREMSDDPVLPEQRRSPMPDTGARGLWRSCLLQALNDATAAPWHHGRPATAWGRDAVRWLLSDAQHIGSCRWICESLNLPLDVVRRGIVRRLTTREHVRRRSA